MGSLLMAVGSFHVSSNGTGMVDSSSSLWIIFGFFFFLRERGDSRMGWIGLNGFEWVE